MISNETYEARLAREKFQNAVKIANLFALATDIAGYLGDGWAVVPVLCDSTEFATTHPHIRRASDGAEFWLGLEWKNDARIDVHANWPRDARGQEVAPHFSQYSEFGAAAPAITFAVTKTAQQAAKDITRRFLTPFLPLWAKQAAVVAGRNDYRARKQAIAERVAVVVGGTVCGPRDRHDSTEHTVRLPYREGRRITDVEFGGDETEISVKLRCTIEQLAQIAELLGETR